MTSMIQWLKLRAYCGLLANLFVLWIVIILQLLQSPHLLRMILLKLIFLIGGNLILQQMPGRKKPTILETEVLENLERMLSRRTMLHLSA